MSIIFKKGDAESLISELQEDSVDMIYFDPPFNSGRDYKIKSKALEEEGNPKDNFGFTDKFSSNQEYADLIEPVVSECSRVLKKQGSFFFHISAEQMAVPMNICEKHFKTVQPIFWARSRSKNNVKNKLGACVDVIFWCSQVPKPKFNLPYQPLDKHYAENSYKNKDKRGNYALGHLVYTKTQATSNEERFYKVIKRHPDHTRFYEAKYGWRVSPEEMMNLMDQDRVHFPSKPGGNLYRKIYMHESKGKPCTNLWDDVHSIAQGAEQRVYPTQKPESLLQRIIEMSTDVGDVVLDPMAGGGTTGIVAAKLDRKAILFDISDHSEQIIMNRTKDFSLQLEEDDV